MVATLNTSLWEYIFIPILQNLISWQRDTPTGVYIHLYPPICAIYSKSHNPNAFTQSTHNANAFLQCKHNAGAIRQYIPDEQSAGPSENNCKSSGQSWIRTVQNRPQDKGHRLATMSTTSAWMQWMQSSEIYRHSLHSNKDLQRLALKLWTGWPR